MNLKNLRKRAKQQLPQLSQVTSYARLAESTPLKSISLDNEALSELTDESGKIILLPVSVESAGLLPKRKGKIPEVVSARVNGTSAKAKEKKMVKICCIGAVGGPTMAVIALKCPAIEVAVVDIKGSNRSRSSCKIDIYSARRCKKNSSGC